MKQKKNVCAMCDFYTTGDGTWTGKCHKYKPPADVSAKATACDLFVFHPGLKQNELNERIRKCKEFKLEVPDGKGRSYQTVPKSLLSCEGQCGFDSHLPDHSSLVKDSTNKEGK